MLPAQLGRVGMHEALPRYAREFGPVCKAFFGRHPIVVITDADMVKQVRITPPFSGSRLDSRLRLHTCTGVPAMACIGRGQTHVALKSLDNCRGCSYRGSHNTSHWRCNGTYRLFGASPWCSSTC